MKDVQPPVTPLADTGARYSWDWVNTGDQEYIDGELRTLTKLRRP